MEKILITSIINFLNVLIFIVTVDVILSFFMDPYNKFRVVLDQLVEPLLNPIRKIIPPMGGFDFSPLFLCMILGFIIQILQGI